MSAILQFFRENNFRNIDDVAVRISDIFDESPILTKDAFRSKIKEIKSDFFRMNGLDRNDFADRIFCRVRGITERAREGPVEKYPSKLTSSSLPTQNTVEGVVKILEDGGRTMEKNPVGFHKLTEEDLRDVLLSPLNALFEGRATGETYSKLGKTDIHLPLTRDNVLIVECKIWNGERYLHDGIDQLLRYLTWREKNGIVIMFCKLQSFSEIIEKAKAVVKKHASYLNNSLVTHGASTFTAAHIFPDDKRKKVLVYYLMFNLYYGK